MSIFDPISDEAILALFGEEIQQDNDTEQDSPKDTTSENDRLTLCRNCYKPLPRKSDTLASTADINRQEPYKSTPQFRTTGTQTTHFFTTDFEHIDEIIKLTQIRTFIPASRKRTTKNGHQPVYTYERPAKKKKPETTTTQHLFNSPNKNLKQSKMTDFA